MESVIDAILDKFKLEKIPKVRGYHFGDPILYPTHDLPLICAAPVKVLVKAKTMGAAGKDSRFLGISLFVLMSIKDGGINSLAENPVDRALIRIVEGVYDSEGAVSENGVLTILRGDIDLGGLILNHEETVVQYMTALRGKEALRTAQVDLMLERTRRRS